MSNELTVIAEPGMPTIRLERSFDAPRDKVFLAHIQKDKLEQWWTGPGYGVRIEELEPHDGGTWRFININSEGKEFPFHGVFHEVTAPERIVMTFEFDGAGKRNASLQSIELKQQDSGGKKTTLLVATEVFLSVEDRDTMLSNGMEKGARQSYLNLDAVLKQMA